MRERGGLYFEGGGIFEISLGFFGLILRRRRKLGDEEVLDLDLWEGIREGSTLRGFGGAKWI